MAIRPVTPVSRAVEYIAPAQVEKRLSELDHVLSMGVLELADRHKKYVVLKTELEIANARAYVKYTGPAHQKKYAAIIETEGLRRELAVAEAAYHFAKSQLDVVRDQVSCVQSIGASMRASMQMAGAGAA